MAVDYYDQVQAAAMAKLRTLSDLFPRTETVSTDIEDLKRGTNYFGYFFPSTFQAARVDGKEKAIVWNVGFELYVRYSSHKTSIPLFMAARAEIFVLYNSDPTLSRLPPALKSLTPPNVFNVNLNATSEVLQDTQAGENPNFIIQTFSLAVSQRVRFDF